MKNIRNWIHKMISFFKSLCKTRRVRDYEDYNTEVFFPKISRRNVLYDNKINKIMIFHLIGFNV